MGFKKAVREQVSLKVLLSGPSGSGKSYSALRLATGIAEKCGGPIGYIGTEGDRDRLYADKFDYDLLQLSDPNYSPEDYIKAIDMAIDAGYKVLVIDSTSHEWKYLTDMSQKMGNSSNSFLNWSKLKPRHQKFMDKVLMSPIHIIATARGKTEWVLETKNGKQTPTKVGMGQQQDKDVSYDYQVSLMIQQDTHLAEVDKDNSQIFDGKIELLSEKHGHLLYDWANSGQIATPKPQKSYETVEVDNTELLKSIKQQIISKATELGGSKNTSMMELIRSVIPSGNPNAIKDLEKARNLLTDLAGIKPVE